MMTWVLGGLDPTEVKASIETRLALEESRVEALGRRAASSATLTSGMVAILTSFERRLEKLEATILPVYQETENLQRRQENIDRTLEAMDHVIAFYNVSKEVEATVRGGPNAPGMPLDNFLQTMSRLKGALDYFEKNNPQSIELENVRTLYEFGGEALSREFSEVLKKHSRPVPPLDILDGAEEINQDYVSIHHFPEDVQTNLIAVAEWLNLNDRNEFMNVYASVRGQIMKKSLEQLREHQRSSSGSSMMNAGCLTPRLRGASSPSMGRKYSSPATEGTPTGKKVSRIQTTINRKFSTLSTKVEARTGLSVGRRSQGNPNIEEHVGESEVGSFCLVLSALQRLMSSEQVLMVGIIPHQYQKKIFEIIVRDSIDSIIGESDGIISKVKKAVSSSDFLAIMSVFQVVKHLMNIKPLMDRTLEGCDASVRSKYNTMIHQFVATGSMALDGFIDGIRSDATTKEKMPRDGTVFQLTSNVILFLEQLLDYVETISSILQQDTSYNQTLLRLPRKISVSDRNHALVGLYIKKILVQLNRTLVNKSDSYPDQFLKAVFCLNNYQYILKSLQKSGLLDVVALAEPECEENYNDMILEQKRLYSQSWVRVLNYIWSDDIPSAILMAPGKLADKYCRLIKEKFAGFNREMEEISSTQRSYSIPDVELRESLKRDNKEYILPKYSGFYDKYANVAFTKNSEKYIKYSPAQSLVILDTDVAKIPCFRSSFMYGIGSGMVTGVAYNLATSKNPAKLAFGTYAIVLFGRWFYCRYQYRQNEHNMKQLRHAMSNYAYLEGTEKDEEWARKLVEKQTDIRNFRSDAPPTSPEDWEK